ncbi:hypothetical protein AQJ91_33100 [Streptomyces dysideae]|uniref:Uncharacterized protein n=1 Tax=Streptomyces dysideae TaxID=909626 RepID=A0A124IE14_9ACTN|nr:hypothetical protein AQJ91_33100 [Streptomyces dysideae]
MVTFIHVDGTSLSAAGSSQRQAVERAVTEAFGDRYELGQVYEQPCVGTACTNVVFTLLSRDNGQSEAFSNGSLSWPDKKHLNVLLDDSDRPSVMGYPVTGAKAPLTEQEAYKIAQQYMREHYRWAKDAVEHKTYPVGEKAELGWMTSWRWLHDDVLMPRMLDVQVNRAGRVSQVAVTLGPTRVKLEKAKLDAGQAEEVVREGLVAQYQANGGGDLSKRQLQARYQVEAFTLKAAERDGTWRPEWLANVSMRPEEPGADSLEPGEAEMWRVDAVNGQVYDGTDTPVKAD